MNKKYGLIFDLDNPIEERASKLMDLISGEKSAYVARLIHEDLLNKNVKDLSSLTERDVKHIIALDVGSYNSMHEV